jgi:hypothetical protein
MSSHDEADHRHPGHAGDHPRGAVGPSAAEPNAGPTRGCRPSPTPSSTPSASEFASCPSPIDRLLY